MKRFVILCVFMIGSAAASFGQNTFYFAHVVNGNAGGVWKTTIFLTNPASSGTATGSISLTQDTGGSNFAAAGTPMNNIMFINGQGQPVAGPTIPFSIGPGQALKFVSTGAGTYSGGFATVTTTSGTVNGTSIFSLFDPTGTTLIGEAGVPAATALPRQSIFVDIGNGYDVGVAFSNVGGAPADVTLTLLNSLAQTVMTTPIPSMGVGNHVGNYVEQFFGLQPGGLPAMTGTLQITSTTGALAAIALRFAPGNLFTTLPPVTLASVLTNTGNALAFILQTLHIHVI